MMPQPSSRQQQQDPSAAVTWVRVASAPSIPAPSQSYGYEEGQYGELIMQKAPTKGFSGKAGDQCGPGAYNIRKKMGGAKARSVDWARSTTTRTDFTKNSGDAPGPGQYQTITGPQTDGSRILDSLEPKGTSSFASKSSRLSGGDGGGGGGSGKSKSSRKKKDKAPGPGAYRTRGAFVVKYVPENLQFFGSTERRFDFKTKMSSMPGPGSYTVAAGVKEESNGPTDSAAYRNPASASVGFTSTSSRFSAAQTRAGFGPDPGTYDTQCGTMIDEMNKKLVSRTGVFGSTTRRFAEIGASSKIDEAFTPESNLTQASVLSGGGSSTLPGSISGRPRRQAPLQRSAAFASKTQRGAGNETGSGVDVMYDVSMDWSKNALKGGKGVLGSGSQRFKHKNVDNEVGPGMYHTEATFIKPGAGNSEGFVSKEKRFDFKRVISQEPGPGSYSPEYLYGNLNKRTFNMTIAEQEALA
tara:strand:+ start:542 stop:1945 length:1404 start_codon:yes stop_codon:yes gene_type:complete